MKTVGMASGGECKITFNVNDLSSADVSSTISWCKSWKMLPKSTLAPKRSVHFETECLEGTNSRAKRAQCDVVGVVETKRRKRSTAESFESKNSKNKSSSKVVFARTATKKRSAPASGTQGTSGETTTTTSKVYKLELKSNRRPVTEEEKQKAFDMATAAVPEDSFIIVMRPSHLYRGFYLSVPSEWARINLPRRSVDVILRVGEKTWRAKFKLRCSSCGYKGYNGRLRGGWNNFVLDNFLEEFDVCVFKLTRGEDATPILDVSIFRVVEEVIAPSRKP